MKPQDLQDLLVDTLRDTLNAERQIISALPKMIEFAENEELATAFEEHLAVTKNQVTRLQEVFSLLGLSARGKHCAGMEGLLEEGTDFMTEAEPGETGDAGIIAAGQKVEHYEIAAYGTMASYARVLGHNQIVTLLEESLEEEREADRLLSEIATRSINTKAATAGDSSDAKKEAPGKKAARRTAA
jgi:ferritin-like metal-binding protein YciE